MPNRLTDQKNLLIAVLLLLSFNFTEAQLSQPIGSTLKGKNFEQLAKLAYSKTEDPAKRSLALNTWLSKAKTEQDYKQMTLAYKAFLYQPDTSKQLQYADSMVISAVHTSDNIIIGGAYLTRATIFYGRKNLNKALDNFIEADRYIAKTNDSYSIYKVKYGIAQTKYYLGFYDEAISLFRECVDYFKEENDRAYLNSLHCLGLCYNRIGNYEWCTVINQMGIDEGKRIGNHEMDAYFEHSEGVNLCCKGRYDDAITKLSTSLPTISKLGDFANVAVAYFYLGKSCWQKKAYDSAIAYFENMDDIFKSHRYIRPDMREGYEHLINYYKKQKYTERQLYYINQLLAVDKVLEANYKYLLKKVVKEYDTKELIKAKEEINNKMSFRTDIGCLIIIVLASVIGYLFYRNRRNKKLFNELMSRRKEKEKEVTPLKKEGSYKIDIRPELEAAILKKLEKFESGKKYLEKDMNLARMAVLLNTNTKYVTKIVAKYRGKRTNDYITELKIDYIVELLSTERKFRNYTYKALGDEAGFITTQHFTNAFKSRTGISPNYFIEQLKEAPAEE